LERNRFKSKRLHSQAPLARLSASTRRSAAVERCMDEFVAFWVRGGMAFSTGRLGYSAGDDRRHDAGNAHPQRIFAGAALVSVALACALILWHDLAGSGADQVLQKQPRLATAASAYARLADGLNAYARRSKASNGTIDLFDSRYSLGFPPGAFAKGAALVADDEPAAPALRQSTNEMSAPPKGDRLVASAAPPVPQLRLPPVRAASYRDGVHASRAALNTGAEAPTIFERLFGKPSPLTLAYANPDDGDLFDGRSGMSGRYDRFTAVYDISAHTVYLPDGSRLEAHSGFGPWLDDPRHTDQRMRGATPPTVYDLKPREGLFHGVRALRLIPEDEQKVFGRSGLLAHSFMLGSNGQSNGCVSFKNYNAFLQAYANQKIKRLAVVARLD
jgi:Protein of unknown function (DUF2778)